MILPGIKPRRDKTETSLPRGAAAVWFAGAGLVNAVGTGFFYPFSILFFHSVYKLSFATVGGGLTVAVLVSLVAMTWVGYLIDSVGSKAVLIMAAALRATAFVGFVTLPGFAGFLTLNSVVAICNRAEGAAAPVLVLELASPGRSGPWFALSQAVQNAGIGLGALLGGLVVGTAERNGFVLLAIANAASFAGAALLYIPLREKRQPTKEASTRGGRPWRDRAFTKLVAVNTVLWLVGLVVETGAPTYLLVYLKAPALTASLLFAVNTGLITILQVPVSARLARRDPWRVMAIGAVLSTILLMVLGAGSLLNSGVRLGLLVAAMAVYTIGELMISQARLLLVTGLAPVAQRGTFLAFNQIFIGAATALGPSLIGVFLDHQPSYLWWSLTIAGLATAAAVTRRPKLLPDVGPDGVQ